MNQDQIPQSRDEIFAKICDVMGNLFDIERSRIVPEARLVEDLGLDSIDAIDLAAHFEELTGQRLREDGLLALRTVDDIVVYLDGCMRGAPTTS